MTETMPPSPSLPAPAARVDEWAPAAWLQTQVEEQSIDAEPRDPAAGGDAEREPEEAIEGEGSGHGFGPLDGVRLVGQLLVWIGSLMLLFALFQLWGTGLLEAQAQQELDDEFETLRAEFQAARAELAATLEARDELVEPPEPVTPTEEAGPVEPAVEAEPAPTPEPEPEPEPQPQALPALSDVVGAWPPREGSAIGRIHIPSIGVTKTLVQGVDRPTLRSGPGHYPTTPLPGQPGNAAIAGHRTTHGAPFVNLDRVQPGEHITVETLDGTFTYEIQGHDAPGGGSRGYFIVSPSAVEVIADHGDNRLTLTACHPKYTARQRIVVTAVLLDEPSDLPVVLVEPDPEPALASEPIDEPVDEPAFDGGIGAEPGIEIAQEPVFDTFTPDEPVPTSPVPSTPGPTDPGATIGIDEDLLEESLGWQREQLDPTVLWGTLFLLVVHAGWIVGRIWRRRPAYFLTAPVAVVPLFLCFVHLDRMLPAF